MDLYDRFIERNKVASFRPAMHGTVGLLGGSLGGLMYGISHGRRTDLLTEIEQVLDAPTMSDSEKVMMLKGLVKNR